MVGRALEGRPSAQRHQRPPAGRLPAIPPGGQDLPHQPSGRVGDWRRCLTRSASSPRPSNRGFGLSQRVDQIQGLTSAGPFHHEGDRVFWDVHDAAKAVVIRLADERYARLVVGVDDPAQTVAAIRQALGTTG